MEYDQWLCWQESQSQWPSCPHFFCSGLTDFRPIMPDLRMKLRSPGLWAKCFTDWAFPWPFQYGSNTFLYLCVSGLLPEVQRWHLLTIRLSSVYLLVAALTGGGVCTHKGDMESFCLGAWLKMQSNVLGKWRLPGGGTAWKPLLHTT